MPQSVESGSSALSSRLAHTGANPSRILHVGAASIVGGVGGFFGLAALPFELSIATVIILRSIAEIAQNSGADLASRETQLECLYVFSLGEEHETNQENSTYYGSRLFFADSIAAASAYLAGVSSRELAKAIENQSAPAIVSLVTKIADQFGVRVTKKALLQSAPVVGAVGGAAINGVFADYFRECARFHFGLKQIERLRGEERTRARYNEACWKHRTIGP